MYPRKMNIKRTRSRWFKKIASKYGVVVKVKKLKGEKENE